MASWPRPAGPRAWAGRQLARRSRSNTLLFALFALVLLTALSPATTQAQTPDEVTPSNEKACDSEFGTAFGLCNAYCEAMDCELLDDGDDETWPNASTTACLRVKVNFIKVTGEALLPCDVCDPDAGQPGCPCDDLNGPSAPMS